MTILRKEFWAIHDFSGFGGGSGSRFKDSELRIEIEDEVSVGDALSYGWNLCH